MSLKLIYNTMHETAINRSSTCCATERTVALLAFEDVSTSPVADLMDIAQRQKTASELNAAILASQGQVRTTNFQTANSSVLRNAVFAEEQALQT